MAFKDFRLDLRRKAKVLVIGLIGLSALISLVISIEYGIFDDLSFCVVLFKSIKGILAFLFLKASSFLLFSSSRLVAYETVIDFSLNRVSSIF